MAFALQTSPSPSSSPSPYLPPRTPNRFRSSSGASGPASHGPAVPRDLQQIHMFTTAHLERLKIAIRGQAGKLRADGYIPRQRGAGRKVDKEAILSDMGLDKVLHSSKYQPPCLCYNVVPMDHRRRGCCELPGQHSTAHRPKRSGHTSMNTPCWMISVLQLTSAAIYRS